jgi:hypothetical protein
VSGASANISITPTTAMAVNELEISTLPVLHLPVPGLHVASETFLFNDVLGCTSSSRSIGLAESNLACHSQYVEQFSSCLGPELPFIGMTSKYHARFKEELPAQTPHPGMAVMPPDREGPAKPLPKGPGTVPKGHHFGAIDSCLPGGVLKLLEHPDHFQEEGYGWTIGNHEGQSTDQLLKLRATLRGLKHCFAYSMADLTGYVGDQPAFSIALSHNNPILQKPRRHSPREVEVMNKNYSTLQEAGFIQPCQEYKYASNTVVAPKKDLEGQWTGDRVCNDYRDINEATPLDHYPMHLPEDLWAKVGHAKYFSKIDLRSGFFQMPIDPGSVSPTGFWWNGKLWQYSRAPFGLKNLPAHFQRVMDYEIGRAGLMGFTCTYIDDILVFSDTAEEHEQHVKKVLESLHAVGLKAHPEKSIFGASVVEFLGHNVSMYGLTPHEAKVSAITNMRSPKDVPELRSVLGFLNYYRAYIPLFAKVASPLHDLLKKSAHNYPWGEDHEHAISCLKRELSTPGRVLRQPDPSLPFVVHTDWSNKGVGAVLGQVDREGQEVLIACISRSLNKHERQYSSFQGELLAAVWAVKTFRHYLSGRAFTLITDHQPLSWLVRTPELTGQSARWAMSLQDYQFTIVHRPGVKHQNADFPSRFPLATTEDPSGARLDEEWPATDNLLSTAAVATLATEPLESASAVLAHHALAQLQLGAECGDFAGHTTCVADMLPLSHRLIRSADDGGMLGRHLQRMQQLRNDCARWVGQARQSLVTDIKAWVRMPVKTAEGYCDPYDRHIALSPICTKSLGQRTLTAFHTDGVVLLELFGGICTGLEALLANGLKVSRYLYCDNDPHARSIAAARLGVLRAHYPSQLPASALVGSFRVPRDVLHFNPTTLRRVGSRDGDQWMVIAGWPCQDISPAGSNHGLAGMHTGLIYPMLDIIRWLQDDQPSRPPAYLLENAALQHNFNSEFVSTTEFRKVCDLLGTPVCVDAACFGSHAHRLRNFWTNLADPRCMRVVLDQVQRPPSAGVDSILRDGTFSKIPVRSDSSPFYVCNVKGQPRQALPTLVSYVGSYSFREEGTGLVWDTQLDPPRYREPYADERERAMGFETGTTSGAGLSNEARCIVIGRSMDCRCVTSLIAIAMSLLWSGHDLPGPVQFLPLEAPALAMVTLEQPSPSTDQEGRQEIVDNIALTAPSGDGSYLQDVWGDKATMAYLTDGTLPTSDPVKRDRVLRRSRSYQYTAGVLNRHMPNGTTRIVPPPPDRAAIVERHHVSCGHFGMRRTTHLLSRAYWWIGMNTDTREVVRRCLVCDQVRATFRASSEQLHCLPIMGMMYRWGVDLAGPFPVTNRGHLYVMICIEHFSKWIEAIPLRSKTAAATSYAFRQHVPSRYGAPAEVLTDGGSEFKGEFEQLLVESLIDHRVTSPNHPQADGLAERAVQTIKRALRKVCTAAGGVEDWDVATAWVVLGYNCSVQASTRCSPYELLFTHAPVVPPAIAPRLLAPLTLDDAEVTAGRIVERAQLLKTRAMIAGGNLAIAQHRDTLRYAHIRTGGYVPSLRRFLVGDFVYMRRPNPPGTLYLKTQPTLLRVLRVLDTGVLELQGKCGRTMKVHSENCAPCHLVGMNGTIDPALAKVPASQVCELCQSPDDGKHMLLCDKCNDGYHTYCLQPPLSAVPKGSWFCPACDGDGVRPGKGALDRPAKLMPKDLDGRTVLVDRGGKQGMQKATVKYLGVDMHPRCLEVTFADGSSLKVGQRTIKSVITSTPGDAPTIVMLTVAPPGELPSQWDLATLENVELAMSQLQPGVWHKACLTKLHRSLPGQAGFYQSDGKPEHLTVTPAEVDVLTRVLDLTMASSILDPWCVALDVAALLRVSGNPVYTNCFDANVPADHHLNPAQPGTYQFLHAQGMLDAVVTAPPLRVAELAIPLACHYLRSVGCFYLPGSFITDAPEPRQRWLQQLQHQGRLCVICGLPKGSTGTRGTWVCVFANAAIRSRMVLGGAYIDNVFILG